MSNLYLIKNDGDGFVEETTATVGINGSNVGIGTTEPSELLTVAGDLKLQTNTTGGVIHFGGVSDSTKIVGRDPNHATLPGTLDLMNGDGSGNSGEVRMRIIPGGNIGIGTVDPNAKLDVYSFGSEKIALQAQTNNSSSFSFKALGGGGASDVKFSVDGNGNVYSAGSIGIGTASPGEKLEINSTNAAGDVGIKIQNNSTTDDTTTSLKFAATTNNNYAHGFITAGRTPSPYLQIGVADTVKAIHINSDGYVGIGTTNPTRLLDLENPDGHSFVSIVGKNDSRAAILLGDTDSDGQGRIDYDNSDDHLHFSTAQTEAVRITSGGNVGIGTTDPTNKLQVRLGSDKNIAFKGNMGEIGSVAGIVAYDDSGALNSAGIRATDIRFANSGSEVMRITSDGKVGIGTTAPTTKFEVQAPIISLFRNEKDVGLRSGLQFKFGDSDDVDTPQIYAQIGGIIESNTAGSHDGGLVFSTAKDGEHTVSQERMRINSDGYVGIGTTSPNSRLSIEGTEVGTNLVANNLDASIKIRNKSDTDGNFASLDFYNSTNFMTARIGANFIDAGDKDTALYFATRKNGGSLARRMIIDESGNVGIGTMDPFRNLSLAGNFRIQKTNSDGSAIGLDFNVGGGADNPQLNIYDKDGNAGVFTIKDGNVGIGTSDPGGKLEINDGDSAISLQEHSGDATIFLDSSNGDFAGGDYWSMKAVGTSRLNFAYGSTDLVNIASNGKVGIGTTNPAAKLDLQLDSGHPFYIRSGSGATDNLFLFENPTSTGPRLSLYEPGTSDVKIVLKAGAGGSSIPTVGIGTSAVDSDGAIQLQVDGSPTSSAGAVKIAGTQPRLYFGESDTTDTNTLVRLDAGKFRIDKADDDNGFVTDGNYFTINMNGGNVGVGTLSPNAKMDAVSFGSGKIVFQTHTNNTNSFPFKAIDPNGATKFSVNGAGAVTCLSVTQTSDDRIKHNEEIIVDAIETISKITPKKYIKTSELYEADHNFNLDDSGNPIDENGELVDHVVEAGVIAQEVLTVPELAFAVTPETVDEEGNIKDPNYLNYNSLFVYAVAAIQEQQKIIEDLKSRIETLES